jgi:hypothetical protein
MSGEGATFRDVFAAKAPWPIPDWFTPSGLPTEPAAMTPPDVYFTYDPDNVATAEYAKYKFYYRDTNYWDDEACAVETGYPVPHAFKVEVSEYWGAYDYNVAERATWQLDYDKERFFQWRWYYADEMLVERSGGDIS